MFRKVIITILAFFFVFSALGTGFAFEKGNKRKGKYTYRTVYKGCFERGACESKTPPISPADKTQAEWETIYTSKDFSQFGCPDEWEKLNDVEVTDIFTYLYEYASDSPNPATCK